MLKVSSLKINPEISGIKSKGTSHKMKKNIYIIRIAKILSFIFLLLLIYTGIDYSVTDDVFSLTRITFHDFYTNEQNIDVVFAGASHILRSVDANQLSQCLDEEFFDLSTSSQSYAGTYTVLKEAVSRYDVKQVYVEASPSIFKLVENDDNTTRTFIISDYLKNPILKTQFLLDVLEEDDYLNGFSTLKRNWDILEDLPNSSEIVGFKRNENYLNYTVTEDYQITYLGKGCFVTEEDFSENGIWIPADSSGFDNVGIDDIDPEKWENFNKIIELCRDNQIELTVFVMPYPDIYLSAFDKYEEFTQYIREFAVQNGCGWFDLNLVKEEYLSLTDSDFMNLDHMNAQGAQKLSDFLVEYLASPSEDYFYSSINDKYKEEKGFYGLTYLSESSGEYMNVTVIPSMDGYGRLSWQIRYLDSLPDGTYPEIDIQQVTDAQISFAVPTDYLSMNIEIQVMDGTSQELVYRVVTTLM